MADYILTGAITLVLSISVLFVLGQVAVNNINPSTSSPDAYSCGTSVLRAAGNGNINCANMDNVSLNSNLAGKFANVTAQSSTQPSYTGNLFTDSFTTAKTWLFNSLGVGWLPDLVSAPSTFLQYVGLPPAFANTFAALWYLVLLFLLVSWAIGR